MTTTIRALATLGLTLAVTLGPAAGALAQDDFSKVEIATTRLSDTTYMMVGAGG